MTKSLTDEQALHAKRDLQTAPKIAPKKKLSSGPNQHTRPHHSTNMKNKKGNKQKQPVQQICRYNHKVLPTKNI